MGDRRYRYLSAIVVTCVSLVQLISDIVNLIWFQLFTFPFNTSLDNNLSLSLDPVINSPHRWMPRQLAPGQKESIGGWICGLALRSGSLLFLYKQRIINIYQQASSSSFTYVARQKKLSKFDLHLKASLLNIASLRHLLILIWKYPEFL